MIGLWCWREIYVKCRTKPVNWRSADWTLLQTQAIGYLKLQSFKLRRWMCWYTISRCTLIFERIPIWYSYHDTHGFIDSSSICSELRKRTNVVLITSATTQAFDEIIPSDSDDIHRVGLPTQLAFTIVLEIR